MSYRIAIVATHPIRYQAPWFRAMALHSELDLEVFFCHRDSIEVAVNGVLEAVHAVAR